MTSPLKRFLRSLNHFPAYRRMLVSLRLLYYVRLRRKLRTAGSDYAFDVTVAHNRKSLGQCNTRIDLLIKPLSVIELVDDRSSVLVIGPRNEHDLFTLVAHGFNPAKIRGLDLISYSPRIDLGDMHATPYGDSTWDVIICGWTLSYSSTPRRFAEEMVRIAKPGALVAIAVEYSTMSEADEAALSGYSIQQTAKLARRINSVAEILDLFSPHVKHVYFSHDAPLKRSHAREGLVRDVSNVAAIFSIDK